MPLALASDLLSMNNRKYNFLYFITITDFIQIETSTTLALELLMG